MADNDLKVRIGADLSQLTTQLAAGTSVLNKFGTSASKSLATTSSALDSIKKSGSGIAASLSSIPAALEKIGDSNSALQRVNQAIDDSAKKAIASGEKFQEFGDKVTAAISQIGAGGQGIPQVTAAINQLVAAGLKAGDGFLAIGVSKPIEDIGKLRSSVNQLKAELASGFKPIINIVDPKIPALLNSVSASLTNISPAVNNATASLRQAGLSAQAFSDKALQSGDGFQDFSAKVTQAISQIKANGAGILQVTAAINDVATAARNAGESFLSIGVAEPIAEISLLKTNVAQLKAELATGFKPIVSIVDPSTPKLLNSFSASLTNIAPAVQAANNALSTAGNATKGFAITVNKSLADAVKQFDQFKIEAVGLSSAFDKIPTSLRPFNTSALVALRGAVGGLKKDVEGLKFTNINSQVNSVTVAASKTATAFKGITPQAKAANFALTDIGRVLQDLPFGFVSIQNNLTQLPGSFRALSLAAKESGQSMGKVLLSSLTGVGGIGLAISAVTAAVTFASVGFGSWSKILGDSGKKAAEAADKTRELIDSIRSVSDIKFDAAGSVQAQIIQVEGLSRAVQDVTKSDKERGAALSQLKDINKSYFGELDLGADSLRKISAATEAYTNAIIQQAIIKELEGEIGKIGASYLKQSNIVGKLTGQIADLRKQQELAAGKLKTGDFFIDETTKGKETAFAIANLNIQLSEAQKLLTPLQQQFSGLKGELEGFNAETLKMKPLTVVGDKGETKKADTEIKALKETLQGYRVELGKLESLQKANLLPKFKEDDVLALKEKIAEILSKIDAREVKIGIKPQLEIDPTTTDLELQKATQELNENVKLAIIDFPVELVPRINKGFFEKLHDAFTSDTNIAKRVFSVLSGITFPIDLTLDPVIKSNVTEAFKGAIPETFAMGGAIGKAFTEGFAKGVIGLGAELDKVNQEFEKTTNKILNETLVNLGVNLGTALGEALGGGQKFDGLRVLFQTLGEALKEMGRALIAAGIAKLAIDKALKQFGAPGMIAAGVLATALGALVTAKINKIPKFAEGGIATGATLGIFGEAGSEAIIPLDRLNEFMDGSGSSIDVHVVGKISGNDMVLLHDKTVKRNSRGGF